jgi:hypothetical protein
MENNYYSAFAVTVRRRMVMAFVCGVLLLVHGAAVYAVGLDLNVTGLFGSTVGVGGNQVAEHELFWTSPKTFADSFSGGGLVTVDIVWTPSLALETGVGFMHSGLEYSTVDGEKYGNGIISVQYNRIQIPVGLQYRYKFKNMMQDSKILITCGVLLSFFSGDQVYKDELTTASSAFLSPSFSQQFYLSLRYMFKLGSGNLIAGISGAIDIAPLSYTINGYTVDVGRSVPVVLELGYSFPILINSATEKENVKKKRVDIYERDD